MDFVFEDRSSDSPFVESIWRTYINEGGSFISLADIHWGMVVTKQHDKITLTVRGPETKAELAPVPEYAEIYGIVFKLGTFMPHLPVSNLVDRELNLPEAVSKSFWLNGSVWQFPNFENIDTFIDRLAHSGLLVYEPVIEDALQGQLKGV